MTCRLCGARSLGHLCPGCSSDIDELTADDPFYVEPKPTEVPHQERQAQVVTTEPSQGRCLPAGAGR